MQPSDKQNVKEYVNKQLITRRFSRAIESYNREATAQKQIAGRLNDMLAHYLPARPRHVLEIGSGTGFLTRPLLRTFHPEKLILNDICHEMSTCFADLLSDRQVTFIPGDAEQLSFPSGQDLIVSCSALQWFVSPEQFSSVAMPCCPATDISRSARSAKRT
mgnify:CR=1 FL=1